jgi:hypothetical protein
MIARVRFMVAVVFFLYWANGALGQGLYWESQTTGIGSTARTTQTYAMPKKMKILNSDGRGMISLAGQEKIITFDTKTKTYREVTFAQMEAAGKAMQAQMQASRAQMEKRMKDMPPEQRSKMEQMLSRYPGADSGKPLVVKNTGETKTIEGHLCTKYVVTDDGKTVLTTWTTKDLKGFDELREDWLAYQKRLEKVGRTFGSAVAEAYAKIEGFPMESEIGEIKIAVTKVEPRSISASEFEVPAGYKKESVNLPKPPPHKPD